MNKSLQSLHPDKTIVISAHYTEINICTFNIHSFSIWDNLHIARIIFLLLSAEMNWNRQENASIIQKQCTANLYNESLSVIFRGVFKQLRLIINLFKYIKTEHLTSKPFPSLDQLYQKINTVIQTKHSTNCTKFTDVL